MKRSFKKHRCVSALALAAAFAFLLLIISCASTSGTSMDTHKKGLEGVTEKEYVIPKKPVDRHFIGSAWSKQFGPVEDPYSADIRIKKEKSFSGVQQDFAANAGFALGAKLLAGPQGEVGIQGSSVDKSRMEGVEIITPVSLADIPFEPNVPYIIEALRLANFAIRDEASNKAGINVSAGTAVGSGTAVLEGGSSARRGTEGEGLVVAYKLNTIDLKSYAKQDSGNISLTLDKWIDIPKVNTKAKAHLQLIEAGASRSLPRNLLWACPAANAKSRDMVAAWIVELRSMDPRRKSLSIAFPAFPVIEDCQQFNGVIYSRIDPLTDKIIRQKLSVMVMEGEVTDAMKPAKWAASISIADESFNIRLVNPSEVGQ